MKTMAAAAMGVLATAVACGSSLPPPNDAWAAAQADVGRAQASGAVNQPDAKLHLQLALDDLAQAKRLMNVDNERATSLTEVARTEAQLAFSLAKEATALAAEQKAKSALANPNATTK
jgi:hypothetical protein